MGVGGRKRSARCMPGLGLVGQRGGEERREEAGLGSGGEREAGGRLRLGAWAWSVKFGQVPGPVVWRRFRNEKAYFCCRRCMPQPPGFYNSGLLNVGGF